MIIRTFAIKHSKQRSQASIQFILWFSKLGKIMQTDVNVSFQSYVFGVIKTYTFHYDMLKWHKIAFDYDGSSALSDHSAIAELMRKRVREAMVCKIREMLTTHWLRQSFPDGMYWICHVNSNFSCQMVWCFYLVCLLSVIGIDTVVLTYTSISISAQFMSMDRVNE